MAAFLLRRVLATAPVIAVVALLVFLMLRLTPGDPAAIMAGDTATAADIQAIRADLGLDRPLYEQFLRWLARIAQGDLGQSFFFKLPVSELILQRAGPTLALAAGTMLITVLVSIPLGTVAAWRRGRLLDRLVMGLSVIGFSVPVFVLGYALIWLFALELGWFPVQGYAPPSAGLGPFVSRLVLPCLTLSVVYIALITRMTRASVIAVLGEDHVRTARAKGLREPVILARHALRNAAVPIVTVIGTSVGLLVGGVVVTETVFNIPGLGRLTVDAVLGRDYPTIQAVVLVFALAYVVINLLVDLSYLALDPRIRR